MGNVNYSTPFTFTLAAATLISAFGEDINYSDIQTPTLPFSIEENIYRAITPDTDKYDQIKILSNFAYQIINNSEDLPGELSEIINNDFLDLL